jgi:SAM-dependent methyltransferase
MTSIVTKLKLAAKVLLGRKQSTRHEQVNIATSNDRLWLDANLNPKAGRAEFDINIPLLPTEEIQKRFTGRHGRANLEQAFDFYKFVLSHMPLESRGRLRVVDFGGGWGRILRFFLREFPADSLVLFDCLTDAIECARSLESPYPVFKNGPEPPLPLERGCADCCYAFSVFSHLSEPACSSWLAAISEVLVPGGKFIFTTRGQSQIHHLRKLSPGNALAAVLPHPDKIQQLYDAGEFQFYPTGGGGELTDNFYGEAWVTRQWIEDHYRSLGFSRYEFHNEFATIDQCVFVMTK